MKGLILLALAVFAAVEIAQSCKCETMKWATCEETSGTCECKLMIDDNVNQPIDCSKLIPKCFLMKAEMYRARNKLDTRTIVGKPTEDAFVDNDGIYDPECERDGKFKAKQNNKTEEYWCVNSAGVRRTDKGDKNMNCSELVETYWVRLQLKHKEVEGSGKVDEASLKTAMRDIIETRYGYDKNLVTEVQYDPAGRFIVADLKKEKTDRTINLGNLAYYMEKDLKVLPLFLDQKPFTLNSGPQNLKMEKIEVFYVDEKAPTFTMKNLSGGIIAVIVVVVLAVVIGLLILFFVNRKKMRYTKTQQREMDNM
ncbi:epithelial cell adhesion molecule [Fundulus heteroclitus]|uniref:epithelial cell adhesion molecule n=1 Tax=Fundulus heteroclitus TaxID=8078 RepID=UPI00165B8404|nr:epithelial cell adhesion molecule [Fundulus heteroclitus]